MLNTLLLDTGTIEWSRAQFASTAMYHWLFVPLTLGLAIIMGVMETCYYRTRKQFWKDCARFWQRLFAVNFTMGVATGIILEFEFGTNWSNYSWFVGDIFGAPLAVEGIVAFFMESTFVAVMFFGWKKVSPGFHLASTWLTGVGATISAWWILVANAWMHYPIGCEFNPDTMRNEMVSFTDVAFSPFAMDKLFHTVISAWIIGAVFTVAVSCWYLLKGREKKLAVESIRIAAIVGLAASVGTALTGHQSSRRVAEVQPMKLAVMEALYNGGTDRSLTAFAFLNPFVQPDYENEKETPMAITVPYALSILATNDPHGYVPGINDILNGYTTPDGKVEPSAEEKIRRGKLAIQALADYRQGKKEGLGMAELNGPLTILKENMKYFGYGYIRDKSELVPFIPINFYSFRVMVGAGCLLILFFAIILFLSYKKDITAAPRWLHWVAIAMIPISYIASECGWLVAEFGRQPWTIQDMLPTWVSVSNLHSSSVMITFFIFLALFTAMLIAELNIMFQQIKKGPEYEKL